MSTKKIQILGSLASSDITVDAELSRTSSNPVQNKVVSAAIDNLNNLVGDISVATQISEAVGAILGTISSGLLPQIIVTVPVGCTITCTSGDVTLTEKSSGNTIFSVPNYGTWDIVASIDNRFSRSTIVVDTVKQYSTTLEFFSATLVVTAESGAVVTVSSGGESFKKTVPNNKSQVTFDIYNAGSYVVSAVASDGFSSDVTAIDITSSGDTYISTCKFYDTYLNNNTWAQIARASESGKASSLWKVGDEKRITVGDETLTLVIIGFDHDDKSDGSGKAGITFALKNLMDQQRQLSTEGTQGGFKNSKMYEWLSDTIVPSLPSDLQSAIKRVNKLTAVDHVPTYKTEDLTIFLFSGTEVLGSEVTRSFPSEGSQYNYFTTPSRRIKYLSNGEGSKSAWILRSYSYVMTDNSMGFENPICITTTGVENYASTSSDYGICFGFSV